jgi:hypothetical protein
MMALNLGIWIVAAFFCSYLLNGLGEPRPVVLTNSIFFIVIGVAITLFVHVENLPFSCPP